MLKPNELSTFHCSSILLTPARQGICKDLNILINMQIFTCEDLQHPLPIMKPNE